MDSRIGLLRKVLDLEKKKGCLDSAVAGGLDRFLANWAPQVRGAVEGPVLDRITGSRYASLTREQRRKWLDEAVGALTGPLKEPEGAPETPVRKQRPPSRETLAGLDAPITTIKGIGPGLAEKFARLGVKSIRDMLYFFPNRHIDYSQVKSISELTEGDEQTIIGSIWQAQVKQIGSRRGTEVVLGDETGNVRAVWFNQPYLAKRFMTSSRLVLSGRVNLFRGRPVFESPEWDIIEDQAPVHAGRLVPVYPLTEGLFPRQVRKLMKDTVDRWAGQVADFLPGDIRERCLFYDLPQALKQAHFPDSAAARDQARLRLAFDELFLVQLGVMNRKREWQASQPGLPLDTGVPLLERFVRCLPFELTEAQHRVLDEIMADARRDRPMCRLLQGDVGSGKTVIATALLLVATANGYQGALMAPTEILAEQHFRTITGLLARLTPAQPGGLDHAKSFPGLLEGPIKVALLVGDLTPSRKEALQQEIASGEIGIVLGTHALIQKEVEFHKLGAVVVDEQHRFGVEQRSALRQKGFNPHMLVMTATPIPRTLALTIYGDLDLSVIDQLPPGRQKVKTRWMGPSDRERALAFIRRQVGEGRQAFIICPLIEESEAVIAQAAVVEYESLSRQVFPDLRLGLLHGKMAAREKDEIMARFRAGEISILVSTPVIEVGIDVPNATVMLIESADRFGLSQLHQFRGRVGRGKDQSYCLLLAENPSEVGRARLEIIERVQDGFALAEEDLKLRGPGEFFGTRQSGLPDLRMARLTDVKLMEQARAEALWLFARDPLLEGEENRLLAAELARVWRARGGEFS